MSRDQNLNAFLYFEAVARRGTLTRAAEELSVSPSAVSQQIKQLEQQLGVKLFRRNGRALSLTLEGEQLFQASAAAISMLREAHRHLGRARESRRLNLRVAPSFGVRWLGPRLHDFIARHPDWDIRVDAAPDPTDFEREIMDLDIRYGLGAWTGFHVAPVVRDHMLPLCSPAYLEEIGGADTPEALFSRARLIDSARNLCQWDFWLRRNGIETAENRKAALMDRSSMALQLAVDGAGVVLESLALALPEVREGRLVPVTPGLPVLSYPAHWATCPTRYLNRRAVRLFMDWLTEQAAAHEAEIAQVEADLGLVEVEIDAPVELVGGAAPQRLSG
ncbi:LysR substrate-binding domain-containing protein [Salipiger mucosus]|uniref:Transcriptional regulator, LysR family n=1 Tax=Salipiger mucosus DSM 16094 TaxID=1123237 RepID=S9RQK8_9RHOB|nr:LysR substrate-binding domain-containing protein [Salipiger mucosus]EPX76289.1 Transcriptional regulator, LysR family [Salipiger mucosus DSM 16094]